jgi:hypothetical protein
MIPRVPAVCLLLITAKVSLPAWGKMEAPPAVRPAEEIILRGRVRLVGTAPVSRLVITDGEDRDWYLEGPDRELLAPLEQEIVTVRGRPEYRDIILANGKKAGVERLLRDLTLSGENSAE